MTVRSLAVAAPFAYVISCEHASNTVPQAYLPYFKSHMGRLTTHEGYDLYAQKVAASLSKKLGLTPHIGNITRLLIDLNRSLHHPACISLAKHLPHDLQQDLVKQYYAPYRNRIMQEIKQLLQTQRMVLHLSIHSFTPMLHDIKRQADLAFLYDPQRSQEKKACITWQKNIQTRAPQLRVRRNYPYQGISDGLVTFCRKQFHPTHYLGIEIEMNQASISTIDAQETFSTLIAHAVTSTHP